MTSKESVSPLTSFQLPSPRNPDIIGLTCSVARIIYLDIEDFSQRLCDNNWIANPQKIPESEYFSYQYGSQNRNTFLKAARAVSIQEISEFLISLNKEFKFSAECIILTIVYIRKFLQNSKIPLMSSNWKNIVSISTLIAQEFQIMPLCLPQIIRIFQISA
ncbi:unnamed protein product [Blepharisma stoltei]|uniref:Cyclin N-terminal domain-containing protein n=1 Tax=Blepharisma stoltei TaxID=1481888 RepID=A0AAU9JJC9_9CILI|nr:unnamed protein product [Blepharisma stoltei]